MSYGGPQLQRGFPATFRTKLGIDDDGTRHVIVESLVGDTWQPVARLGSVETDKFLTNESMGGYRYKHHEHKQASGVAAEYSMLRMSTGGDGTSVVAGNYDAPVHYLASGEGGWQLIHRTDVDTTDDTGDRGDSFVEVTEFITTVTPQESTLLDTISVDCSEAVSDVAFNTTVLSNDLSTVHSKHQTQLTFDSLPDDEQRFKLELTAGINVLPFPQSYPVAEGETCTLRYQFNRPVKLRTDNDGIVWGTVHGKKLVFEQAATQEWASGALGAMEVDVADIDTLDTSDLTLGKEINVTSTGSEGLADTKVIVGKMRFNGAELEDISSPKDVFFGGSESGDRRWLQTLTIRHAEVVYVAPQLVGDHQLLVSSYARKLRVRYTSDIRVTNPISLLFPSGDIFELSHAGDDVEFSKIGSVWYYANTRNNEKGEF